MTFRVVRLVGAALALGTLAQAAIAELRVGAAKVDITPPASELFEPYTSIHDRIFTRAIVVENNGVKALLMNLDVGNMQPSFADPLMDTLSSKFG